MKTEKENKTKATRSKTKNDFAKGFWERLATFVKLKGDNFHRLTRQLNLSQTYFITIINNNGIMGSDVLTSILQHYPELNPEWLLIGTGTMLKNASMADVKNFKQRMELHKEMNKQFSELEKVWNKIKDLEVELKK